MSQDEESFNCEVLFGLLDPRNGNLDSIVHELNNPLFWCLAERMIATVLPFMMLRTIGKEEVSFALLEITSLYYGLMSNN